MIKKKTNHENDLSFCFIVYHIYSDFIYDRAFLTGIEAHT